MNHEITGGSIRRLRQKQGLTQAQLAERLRVSAKTVSKWETARGLPDVTLLEPLAAALNVSLAELLSGRDVCNENRAGNLLRAKLCRCPACGNLLWSTGSAAISCCGRTLTPMTAQTPDSGHAARMESVEDEIFVTIDHEMTRAHSIVCIAYLTGDRFDFVRLYPEGPAQARFFRCGHGRILWCCTEHGLFEQKI